MKEGLVAHPLEWPGVSSDRALLEQATIPTFWWSAAARRAAKRAGRPNDLSFAERNDIVLTPLPCHAGQSPSQRRELYTELLEDVAREAKLLRGDRPPLGVDHVLSADPFREHPIEATPAPIVHASTPEQRADFLHERRQYIDEYRAAARHLPGVARLVPFPEAASHRPCRSSRCRRVVARPRQRVACSSRYLRPVSPCPDERIATIAAAIASPSYTPGWRDVPAVAKIIATDPSRRAVATRALLRAEPAAALDALRNELRIADAPGAASLAGALGRLARAHAETQPAAAAVNQLLELLEVESEADRVARAAIEALGKVGGPVASGALRALAGRSDLPPRRRRALIEALAKLSLDISELVTLDAAGSDPSFERAHARAVLMNARDRDRSNVSTVRSEAVIPPSRVVICRCRAGLEDLLARDLRSLGIAVAGVQPGIVRARGGFPFTALQPSRLWTSVAIEVPCTVSDTMPQRDLAAAIADALTAPPVRHLLADLTEGRIRWRLSLAGAGHRRAVVWETARAVMEVAPELLNDPIDTTWNIVVDVGGSRLELHPRRLDDVRFRWRVADIPAASHPTIAAALARMSQPRADDIIWDPFCGSGSELVERALLGPYRAMVGTDLDPRALAAARANLDAARVRADLVLADATLHAPGPLTLIITNPPLGRRLRGDPLELMTAFVRNAAHHLVARGRLVWVTPHPARTERPARAAGLGLEERRAVDLGGFEAHIERWAR